MSLDLVRSDFRNFLYLAWRHLGYEKPTICQYEMAEWLQHGPDRLMAKGFRGVGKSYVAAAFADWFLDGDPNRNVIVLSAAKARSDAFTTFALRLIDEMPYLARLRPKEHQRRSMMAFDVGPAKAAQTPSMYSVGIFGTLTGFRADLIIADDIEVPNNAETITQREKIAERTKEFESVLKPGGRIIYLGTDQTEDSLYRELPERKFAIRCWPARIDSPEEIDNYTIELKSTGEKVNILAPAVIERLKSGKLWGRSLEPERFTEEKFAQAELTYGKSGFALQFKLDPRLSDVDLYPLKCRDLMTHPLDAELAPEKLVWCGTQEYADSELRCVGIKPDRWQKALIPNPVKASYKLFDGTVLSIDPAGRGRDETGYAVVSCCNSLLYLRASGGLKGYETATLEELAKIASRYKVNSIVIEPNFGDGMFQTLFAPILKKIHPCQILESERSNVQKEKRIIDCLEPVISGHRLVVDRSVIQADYDSVSRLPIEQAQHYRLFYQLTHITREKGCLRHDDRLDALALAVAYWQKAMGRDVESAVQASRQQALDKELKRFAQHVLGHRPRPRSWVGHI